MARHGFLAELQRAAKAAAREQARMARENVRARNAAAREAAKRQREHERNLAQQARAEAAEQRRLDKLAKEAYIADREAEVEELNAELTRVQDELSSLLSATLDVDDFVDLEMLRVRAEHPPFPRPELERPTPPPVPIADPPEPIYAMPPAPTGLRAVFGKRKHLQEVERSVARHERMKVEWKANLRNAEILRAAALDRRNKDEKKRLAALAKEREKYEAACAVREEEAAKQNEALDQLITNLAYGDVKAVEECVSIVLANSVYPDSFPVNHEFEFDAPNAELKLRALLPGPDKLSTVKAYRYKKSTDEITSTQLTQKACKDTYALAVNQVALRSLHEVFEADRRGIIKSISLEVGTSTINPATGLETYVPFVAAAAERESFVELNLASVVPDATLAYLGAAVSKNPYGLDPADVSGIRKS
ncbi:MAG: hypothetical protein H6807_08570 [Planctomycetes bacterium]|nr:hypothetical protein [Polyangiaceae bacterium]MCB9832516.1 hypothetical protein [Planctomycetota bacterium]